MTIWWLQCNCCCISYSCKLNQQYWHLQGNVSECKRVMEVLLASGIKYLSSTRYRINIHYEFIGDSIGKSAWFESIPHMTTVWLVPSFPYYLFCMGRAHPIVQHQQELRKNDLVYLQQNVMEEVFIINWVVSLHAWQQDAAFPYKSRTWDLSILDTGM